MSRQHGYVLLPVVLLVSLVAAAAYMLNHESALEGDITASVTEAVQTRYVAEAGLQHTLAQITQAGCGPYTDITSQSFGNHSYSSTITTNSVGGTITTYTVAVSDDAWIKEDQPTNNYGSDAKLEVYNKWFASEQRRALYRFDIAASGIPAEAMVVSAVVKIFVVTPDLFTPVSVHAITEDWTEDAVTWDSIAVDHDSSSVASITTNPPAGQYVDVNITPLVQSWISGSVANQGIMLKPSLFNNASLSEYTSKEYATASQRPYLEIKVADGSLATLAHVSTSGTLIGGSSHTMMLENIPLYQPPSSVVWQPGTELEDTFIWDGAHTNINFGTSTILNIKNDRNVLIRFALEALPPGARVTDARLGLYLEGGTGVINGVLDLHRISRSWVEGIYDDVNPATGEGVTYQEYDGGNSWTTPGGDYDATVIDSITLPTMVPGWHEWNVTDLVQSWLDGTPNYGLILREGGGDAGDIDFTSSDSPTDTQHPRLTLTFACECGTSCQIPQGSGNVLLVVGDDVTINPVDVKKQALFEAWGYSVNLINDGADQATFDTALANNDVAYISETVWGPTLSDKLAATDKGVVNEEEDQNSRLGLSSSGSNTVGDSMEVIDNSHYITALFPNDVLPIFSAPMEGMLVTGTPAPGLQTLGNFSGTASLALVNGGGTLQGGSTAPGHRVAIPIGSSDKFNWDYLNNNGRLIVQRAIQWGTGNDGTCSDGNFRDEFNANVYSNSDGSLDWSGDWIELDSSGAGPSAGDVYTFGGSLVFRGPVQITEDKSSGTFIYDPGLAREVDLSTFLSATLSFSFATSVGVETAEDSAVVEVSGDGGTSWTALEDFIDAGPNATASRSYDITPYIAANTQVRFRLNAGYGGANEFFYVDDIDIAAGCSPPPDLGPFAHWKLDDAAGTTAVDSEGGHDGTLVGDPTWSIGTLGAALDFDGDGDRVDVGPILDAGSPQISVMAWVFKRDSGDDRVISKSSGSAITDHVFSLGLANTTIRVRLRTTDNGGTSDYDGGTLSLNQWVHVAFTYDGGTLRIYKDGTETASYTITGDMIASTLSVAIGNVNATDNRYWNGLLDDVRIYDRGLDAKEIADLAASGGGGKVLEPLPPDFGGSICSGTFRDEFTERVYSGNNGTLKWAGDWQEINESDGPTSGDEQVFADLYEVPEMPTYQLFVRDNDGGGEGVMRALNLSGAITATLSFDYKPFGLDKSTDYASVQMSTTGTGGPWGEVVRFKGPLTTDAYQPFSADVSKYISTDAVLRIITSKGMGSSDYLWLDNIQITCSSAIAF